ncbi:formylglycine-generating enzyme family protein [Arthrobacter polaris]|uniref:formylglycine-generating enzyme family protein n=1 Tax=Arthrobacter polaris TaxID=2813727 RepID=UPI001F2870BD|nr:SUMF1/EgtB/PvdO family nonheme iron enzyme [Arthrobacter polaris]UIK88853.1 SUMF1/EgtB/PvdO family nonheme iron enzyme [Arthrobacter polaris]
MVEESLQELLALAPVPGGTLTLRDARSGSSRDVQLGPVQLARTQNTRATWFAVIQWCNEASDVAGFTPVSAVNGREVTWEVSADGYRLPTEAEWEWAARARTLTPVYGPLADIAWTAADALEGPQDVALKKPNDFGMFDTISNVWECCWDYADTARHGEYRCLCGGGWDNLPWSARASVRRGSAPDAVLEDVGFRVARGALGASGTSAAQGWTPLRTL